MDENDKEKKIEEKNNTTLSSNNIISNEQNKINEKKEINNNHKKSDSSELLSLINVLSDFESELKNLKSINNILNKENFLFFRKLSKKENMKINLLLIRIYMIIITNKSLYNEFLVSINGQDSYKMDILFLLIDNCISLIEKMDGFVFSSRLFEFKKKTIDLIKCLYFNCKNKIKEQKLEKLHDLMELLPTKFFSESFLELNKSKDLYEILKSQISYKITAFEEKFSEINNYYEQFESFKIFIENNSGTEKCFSVDEDNIGKKNLNITEVANKNNIDFYVKFGTLILKFCKYHKYMFLENIIEDNGNNKEKEKIDEKNNEKKENNINDENKENIKNKSESENDNQVQNPRILFLLDRIDQEKNEKEKDDKNKKIETILKNKQYVSTVDSKEYKLLIKKEIKFYLELTKNIETDKKIKMVRDHLSYYLSNLDIDSFFPLYLKDFSKIIISDNFTPSYLTNVPAGKEKRFYFETKSNVETLIYIEFYLEDKSKDINFRINKYEVKSNEFKPIFKDEKMEDSFRFFINCHGYSLYELVFDNTYSWFNSKDVNYRISLLTLHDKSKKEKEEDEDSYDDYDIGEKEVKYINIPIILYLNNIKIVSFKESKIRVNNKSGKNKIEEDRELIFKEHIEEDEINIPRHLFNYLLINHIKKLKIEKSKHYIYKYIISIFSLNSDLLSINNELEEQIKSTNNVEEQDYIKKIGFIPENIIDDFNFEYKLYDLYEQTLIYHMSSSIKQKTKIAKTILIIQFDQSLANAAVYNNGHFFTKLQGEEQNNINMNNINVDNINEIYNIIKNMNEGFEGMQLILTYNKNIKEENKNKLMKIFDNIKQYNKENIIPPLKIFEYEENDICNKAINYTDSFYDNGKKF